MQGKAFHQRPIVAALIVGFALLLAMGWPVAIGGALGTYWGHKRVYGK